MLALYQQFKQEGEAFKPRFRQILATGGSLRGPNLATTLGLTRGESAALAPMPRSILREDKDAEGKRIMSLAVPPLPSLTV